MPEEVSNVAPMLGSSLLQYLMKGKLNSIFLFHPGAENLASHGEQALFFQKGE